MSDQERLKLCSKIYSFTKDLLYTVISAGGTVVNKTSVPEKGMSEVRNGCGEEMSRAFLIEATLCAEPETGEVTQETTVKTSFLVSLDIVV